MLKLKAGNAKIVGPPATRIVGKRPRESEGESASSKKPKGNIANAAATQGNPVHIPTLQKYVIISMCKSCLEETWGRIKLLQSGRQFITFVLCPKCVHKNQTLTNLFK